MVVLETLEVGMPSIFSQKMVDNSFGMMINPIKHGSKI